MPRLKSFFIMFLGVFIFTLDFAPLVRGDCLTIPISLSNLTSCVNSVCDSTQVAILDIPAVDGSKACVEFISPDGTTDPVTIEVTLIHAHYRWLFDYYYYTDSPSIRFSGYCSCSSFTATSCNSCPVSTPSAGYTECLSGIHNSPGCVLPGTGSWCGKAYLGGWGRFKVLHAMPTIVKDFGILVNVTINGTSEYFPLEYDGLTMTYSSANTSIDLTVVSDTSIPQYTPEFVVFDLASDEDFYLMTSDLINGLDEYNAGKFGWFKPYETVMLPAGWVEEHSTVIVTDCQNDEFSFTSSLISPEAFLSNMNLYLSQRITPGSILKDPEWDKNSYAPGIPNHEIEPYATLDAGWIIMSPEGLPAFIGIANTGAWWPITYQNVSTSNTPYNIILETGDTVTIAGSYYVSATRIINANSRTSLTYIYMVQVVVNGVYHFGICMNGFTTAACVNASIDTYLWPEMDVYTIWFNGTFHQFTDTPNHNVSSSLLTTESNNGVMQLSLSYNNLDIRFTSISVNPVISSISQDSIDPNYLNVIAYSASVGGDCYFGSNPSDIVISQPITLTMSPQTFKFMIYAPQVDATVQFIIKCYSRQITYSTKVVLNNQNTNTVVTNTTITQKVANFFKGIDTSFDNWSDYLSNVLGGSTWGWSLIIKILGYCAIGCLCILVLVILVKIIQYGYTKSSIRNRFPKFNYFSTKKDLNKTLAVLKTKYQ